MIGRTTKRRQFLLTDCANNNPTGSGNKMTERFHPRDSYPSYRNVNMAAQDICDVCMSVGIPGRAVA